MTSYEARCDQQHQTQEHPQEGAHVRYGGEDTAWTIRWDIVSLNATMSLGVGRYVLFTYLGTSPCLFQEVELEAGDSRPA
jgi:hypothetical protein